MAHIAACVSEALKGRNKQEIATAAEVSPETVTSVATGKDGTGVRYVDRVVRALGMEVVADCIPAADAQWKEQRERLLAQVREREARMDWDPKAAERLINLCEFIIKDGQAGAAVKELLRWQAGGPHSNNHPKQTGGGSPLA